MLKQFKIVAKAKLRMSRGLARWESCRRAVAVVAVGVTWKLGSETVLVFGPESVSYERSRLIRRCILREISARVFFGKIPKYRKKQISNISRIWENWKNQISNISRIGLNQKNPFSNISRILENVADLNFQYFQAGNNSF